ncbi:MAG: glycosyltransferase family 39 protein [Bacteroidales bacterium]|nr:glycosyltransferase family 39 protein [Bacteroidales bacterium]
MLKPDGLVAVLLAAWGIVNLLQAAFTGLANDEAYYWYYAQHMAWGYFDHPPMVALLVKLSQWLPGALGIRFFSTLLQPCYLYLLWRMVRPTEASRHEAVAFVLICFSQPLLQLYGFLALPDAPLMMFTAVFLWAYKRFLQKETLLNATWLGLAAALLCYSKYHGILVVALVVMSNPRLLTRWKLYWAGTVALLAFVPHLWWQYEHQWVSVNYHLVGRNAWEYKSSYTTEYLATLLVLFNPLWLWHYVQAIRRRRLKEVIPEVAFRRSLYWLLVGFLVFFLIATLRGHVQAQWLLPVVFPLVALLFAEGRKSQYVKVVGWVCVGVFMVVRVIAVANPFQLKGEIWGQEEIYRTIAQAADGKPVQFMHNYTAAAKYTYYTGETSYCAPYFYNRQSQWQMDTSDRALAHREVVVGDFGEFRGKEVALPNGRVFTYRLIADYLPMRELKVSCLLPINFTLSERDSLGRPEIVLPLAVSNPYPYDIVSTENAPIGIQMFLQPRANFAASLIALLPNTIKANSTTVMRPRLHLDREVPDGRHVMGFAVGYTQFPPSGNNPKCQAMVQHTASGIHIQQISK